MQAARVGIAILVQILNYFQSGDKWPGNGGSILKRIKTKVNV